MAENYTLFAGLIEDLTPEEVAWFDNTLCPTDESPNEDNEEKDSLYYDEYLRTVNLPPFEFEIANDEEILFYSDGHGEPDEVARLVQHFLRKFRPDDVWGMEIAYTCSRAYPGQFGGACFVVTANNIRWSDTASEMGNLILEIKKAKEDDQSG